MRVADYAEVIRNQILQTPYVMSHSLAYEERSPAAGLVRGSVTFVDRSRLLFKEFIRVAGQVVRLKYSYHYVTAAGSLVFRYDNALDPAAKHLASYPDHKHLPDGIHPSTQPLLEQALREAGQQVKRP